MASTSWASSWVHPAGSVIIITGAGSGIGLATAVLAAKQGYKVAAWDISSEGLKKTIEMAGEFASSIHPFTCDIADEAAVNTAMAETAKVGTPMMLVNNAGPVAIGGKGGFMDMTAAAFAMVHYPTTAFLETKPPKGASIVNISSVVGPIFGGGGPWYSAAKAGIFGFTKNLAASLKGSVRVNTVAPGGPIRTPRNSKFIDDGGFNSILERNPTGRPGQPEELANGIMFLLSPAASYINGHMLPKVSSTWPSPVPNVLTKGFTREPFSPYYHTSSPSGSFAITHPSSPFIAFHPSFSLITGPNPKLDIIASSEPALGGDGQPFAHEAGVWVEETQEVWFTSNFVTDDAGEKGVKVSKIRVDALERGRQIGRSWDDVVLSSEAEIVNANGGTMFGKEVLLCVQGRGMEVPSGLHLISPVAPYSSRCILNNFHGRQFNSLNDVVVLPPPCSSRFTSHPQTRRSDLHYDPHTTIWFTDPAYGFAHGIKSSPNLPNQVYCFNPTTGDVRVVADGFGMPNGIAFDHEGRTCYITDTSAINGDGKGTWTVDSSKPSTIYAFDVVRPPHGADLTACGPTLRNRRVFAYVDSGVPDGIKTDTNGNVYSGCGDGIQVWNKHGTLIGRIVLPPSSAPSKASQLNEEKYKARGCANFVFTPGGRMLIFAEDRIYRATLGPGVEGLFV
ncbi:hypothetical protein MNV49_001217 [Pseudohyphozyma bogoriensis]|nr:hypothetical protein MNV49_001217 [Pseudohyphozyma bogoriensis]